MEAQQLVSARQAEKLPDCADGEALKGVQSTPADHVGSVYRSQKLSERTGVGEEMEEMRSTSTQHLKPALPSGQFNTRSSDKKRSLDEAEEGMSLFSTALTAKMCYHLLSFLVF